MHQGFHENLLLVVGELPDGVLLYDLPGSILQGGDHEIGYCPALNLRGALNEFLLTGRNTSLKTPIPPAWHLR